MSAYSQWATLAVSDGSRAGTVSLLKGDKPGFQLKEWQPKIVQPKGGGTYQDSSLAPMKRLVASVDDTVTESFILLINHYNQDLLIEQVQNLLRLLLKARAYWLSDWQNEPVYLKARSQKETNERYCLLHNFSFPELGDVYNQPFFDVVARIVAMDKITLTIERGHWGSSAPGSGTAVYASAVETFNGRGLGTVDSNGDREVTTSGVYLSNKCNVANLTHIFHYDDSTTTFSSNLLDASLPFKLFPDPAGVDDIIYFGVDTSVTDSGPFTDLVFDIGTAAAGTYTLTWLYSITGDVSTLTVQDNTNNFTNTGLQSVHWIEPFDFVPLEVNGVTAYWVACQITAFTSMGTVPQQRNRNIYSTPWAYAEVQAADIEGDIPALLQIQALNVGDRDGIFGSQPDMYHNRLLVGLRSVDRGENFRPFINLSTEQNPDGITVSGAGDGEPLAQVCTPTGQALFWNAASTYTEFANRSVITFDSSIGPEYYGTYHAFVRAGYNDGTDAAKGDIFIRLKIMTGSGGMALYSQVGTMYGNFDRADTDNPVHHWQLVDLGGVTIAGPTSPGDVFDSLTIGIQMKAKSTIATTPNIVISDLILLPVDEWAADCLDVSRIAESIIGQLSSVKRYLDIDGVTVPKMELQTVVRKESDDSRVSDYNPVANGRPMLQANARQRLWFLMARNHVVTGTVTAASSTVLTDSTASFLADGVEPGDILYNATQGCFSVAISITETAITGTPLAGGTNNNWNTEETPDEYYIITKAWVSNYWDSYRVELTANQQYLGLRGAR